MNFELGWRDVGITLFAIAQHFSLFTFHFSLPEETTFHFALFTIHFPKGLLFTRLSHASAIADSPYSLCEVNKMATLYHINLNNVKNR